MFIRAFASVMSTNPPPPLARGEIEDLLRRLRPRLRQILASFRVPLADAEDLLQDVLVAAFCKWDSIHSKEAWVIGTLRNTCAVYWKRQRRNRVDGVAAETLESLSEPQPPAQARDELLWDIDAAAESLCRRHRTVLWLRFGLGFSTAEIAASTGYNCSSIRKLTCRSVARLQRELNCQPTRRAGPKPA
jgi:RNA polymerase sigma factor (sigma-70 family)